MEEIAEVYARSLFEVAQEHDTLDTIHEQLGQFTDALDAERDLQVFFFSPYFSSQEKKEGIAKLVEGADERFESFLELLAERHRMPVVFRIRRAFDALWAEERRLLEVTVTSAVELDDETVRGIGERIEEGTGRKVDLTRVRRSRRARRARAPRGQPGAGRERPQPPRETQTRSGPGRHVRRRHQHADQARRDHEHPQGPHRGARRRRRRPVRGGHRPVDRRRHRPRARARELHGARAARVPPRRHGAGPQPRVRQRGRGALRGVGARARRATRSSARTACSRSRWATACSGASSRRSASPLDGKGDIESEGTQARGVQGPGRGPAPARARADADRPQGHRLDDPDRPRPA